MVRKLLRSCWIEHVALLYKTNFMDIIKLLWEMRQTARTTKITPTFGENVFIPLYVFVRFLLSFLSFFFPLFLLLCFNALMLLWQHERTVKTKLRFPFIDFVPKWQPRQVNRCHSEPILPGYILVLLWGGTWGGVQSGIVGRMEEQRNVALWLLFMYKRIYGPNLINKWLVSCCDIDW